MVENRRRGDQTSTNFSKKWYFGSFRYATEMRTKKKGLKKDRCWRSGKFQDAQGGSPDGMCTAGGRVREGKPSLVRTGVNVVQDAGRGAADSNAPRILPSPIGCLDALRIGGKITSIGRIGRFGKIGWIGRIGWIGGIGRIRRIGRYSLKVFE